MAGLFPPSIGQGGGATDFRQQQLEMQQTAIQKMNQQAFQHSWYILTFSLINQESLFKTVMSGVGGMVFGGAIGIFLSGMRYDAPGAFAIPGGPGQAAFNNLKWHRQLYEGIKDMGQQGIRSGKVLST